MTYSLFFLSSLVGHNNVLIVNGLINYSNTPKFETKSYKRTNLSTKFVIETISQVHDRLPLQSIFSLSQRYIWDLLCWPFPAKSKVTVDVRHCTRTTTNHKQINRQITVILRHRKFAPKHGKPTRLSQTS